MQLDAASGLGEEEEDTDQEGHVGQALDPLDPAPPDGLIDETGVDGSRHGTEDGDPREQRHWAGALVREVHVVEGTTDENGANTAKETEQESESENGADVLGEGQTDKEQGEAEECAGVDDLPADKLTERRKYHGREGTGEVESEQTDLANLLRCVQFLDHASDTRAVCSRSKADEESHETKHSCDKALVRWLPVVRVLLVVGSIFEDNVLFVVVVDKLGQRERHVNVDSLYRPTVWVDLLVGRIDIFSPDNTSDLGVSLLVPNHVVRVFQHRHNIRSGFLSLHLWRRTAGPRFAIERC